MQLQHLICHHHGGAGDLSWSACIKPSSLMILRERRGNTAEELEIMLDAGYHSCILMASDDAMLRKGLIYEIKNKRQEEANRQYLRLYAEN